MRLLIITHGYAPALNARAFRWTALAEHWAAAGHDVEVITVRSAGKVRTESVNGVRIHRVGMYLEKLGVAARQAEHQIESGRVGIFPEKSSQIRRGAMRLAKKIHDVTWKRIYWPDYAAPWIPFALVAGRKVIARSRPTAVISVSLPFSSHLAARFAGISGEKIPWIVDIGDPFSFATATPVNNHRLYSTANMRAEAAVIRAADGVTVTTRATARAYNSAFRCSEKITVIPPLLSILPSEPGAPGPVSDSRRLVYVGTLNRHIRNPDRLLAIFDAMINAGLPQDIHLHFYGETGDCAKSFQSLSKKLGARIHVHGLVPRQTAVEAMRTALAVVNIGNSTTLQLPSKLVEYVASARPIINLAARANDSSADFLEGVSGVLNLTADASVIDDARSVVEFLQQADVRRDTRQWLSAFSLDVIARQYEAVIKKASFV